MTNEINNEEKMISVVIPPTRTSLRESLEPPGEVGRRVQRFIRNIGLAHDGFEDESRINRRIEYQYGGMPLGAGVIRFLRNAYFERDTNNSEELYFGDHRNFESKGKLSAFELSLWNRRPLFDPLEGFFDSNHLLRRSDYRGPRAEADLWIANGFTHELLSKSKRVFECITQLENLTGYSSVNLYRLK